MKINCAACGKMSESLDRVGFRDTCPSCDAYLHSCENCGLYVNSNCTEPSAEKVSDSEGMNFCEWFQSRSKVQGPRSKEGCKEAAEEMWRKLTGKN